MSKSDPLGYYAALNVSPGANDIEIVLAFKLLKRAHLERRKSLDIGLVQEAYDVLRVPSQRNLYDQGKIARRGGRTFVAKRPRSSERTRGIVTLAVLAVILVAVLAVIYGSSIRATFIRFDPGDTLYRTGNVRPLGSVVQYDEHHVFPNGADVPAYRIKSASTGAEKWYPASDLERHYERR